METKTYYDMLFEESEKEKEITGRIDAEIDNFKASDEYKNHEEALKILYEELKVAQKERRDKAREFRPVRFKHSTKVTNHDDSFIEEMRKENIRKEEEVFATFSPDVVDVIKKYRTFNEEERSIIDRYTRGYHPFEEELKKYHNPVTTHKDVSELQDILVQETLDFINEKNLTDIDAVSFYADGLKSSAREGYWTPATDASLTVEGIENDPKYGWVRRIIDKIF